MISYRVLQCPWSHWPVGPHDYTRHPLTIITWKDLGIMPPCPERNINFWTWLLKDCPQWKRMFIPCVYLIETILKFQWAMGSPEVHVRITDPPHLYPHSRKFCLETIRPRDLHCLKDSALTTLPERLHCGFSWFPLQHLPLTNEYVSLGPEQTEKTKQNKKFLSLLCS